MLIHSLFGCTNGMPLCLVGDFIGRKNTKICRTSDKMNERIYRKCNISNIEYFIGSYLNRKTNGSANNHCILSNYTCANLSCSCSLEKKAENEKCDCSPSSYAWSLHKRVLPACANAVASPGKKRVHPHPPHKMFELIPPHSIHWKRTRRMRSNWSEFIWGKWNLWHYYLPYKFTLDRRAHSSAAAHMREEWMRRRRRFDNGRACTCFQLHIVHWNGVHVLDSMWRGVDFFFREIHQAHRTIWQCVRMTVCLVRVCMCVKTMVSERAHKK